MIIRSISLKNVAGSTTPSTLPVGDRTTRVRLDARAAPSLPAVIMTLLFPEEVSVTDIARVAGSDPSSAWRAEFESEESVFRVSRSFLPESIVLERLDQDSGSWNVLARGASDVRRQLAELVKLPPPTVMEALNFWINPFPRPGRVAAPSTGDDLKLDVRVSVTNETLILGSDDYFGNFGSGSREAATADEAEPPGQDLDKLLDEFRRAQTIEFVDDQIRVTQGRLDKVIERYSAIGDKTGELARLTRRLSELPELRELTDEERAALTAPDSTLAELERRRTTVDYELDQATRVGAGAAPALWRSPVFILGVVLTVGFTGLSLFGPPMFRRFAIANILGLSFSLVGFLGWLEAQDASGRLERKLRVLGKRRDQLEREAAVLTTTLRRVRDDLLVRSLSEYERMWNERSELETRIEAIREQSRAAFESPEAQELEAKKAREQSRLEVLRSARRRLGDEGAPTFELRHALSEAGIEPEVALWRPLAAPEELRVRLKRLGQVASRYRLVSESGLNPKTIRSWTRIAERLLGRGLEEVNLTPDNQIVDAEGNDLIELLDESEAIAVVEALRMSLHLTLVKASAPGIHPFAIDIYPERIASSVVRERLDGMYASLGERIQVLVVASE